MHLTAFTHQLLRVVAFREAGGRRTFKKCLLAMKLVIVLLTAACITASASGSAQQRVTIHLKDVPVSAIFREVIKQTGMSIICNQEIFKDKPKVSVNVKDASVSEVLEECIKGLPVHYELRGNKIIIQEKKDNKINVDAPPITVRGKIVNENGEAIVASITIKGTGRGVTSNEDGTFELNDVDEKAVLVISATNIETREIKVNSKVNVGNVAVMMKVESMNEVVINKGYYTEKQKFSVGNASKVTAKDMEGQPVQNPLLAMQGRVPGVLVTQNTGVPGGGVSVRIQGQNSIARGSDPLYVVDGMPFYSQLPSTGLDGILGGSGGSPFTVGTNSNGSPLNYLNPSDIESIEVLKDADATAIYGSRAANGAILITTKKGQAGRLKTDLNFQRGVGKVGHKMKLLNSRQYLDVRYEALENDGIDINALTPAYNTYDLTVWDTSSNTDWQNELIGGTANYLTMNAGFSGGSSNTQYLISGTYHKETTVFPGDFNDQKGSIHFDITSSSENQRLKLRFSGLYMNDDNKLLNTDLTNLAVSLVPVGPVLRNNDGSLNWAPDEQGNSTWDNPLHELLTKYRNRTSNLLGDFSVSYEILEGLSAKTSFGFNNIQTEDFLGTPLEYYKPEDRPYSPRIANYGDRNLKSWIFEPQINFNHRFSQHHLNILVGSTIQQNIDRTGSILGMGYASNEVLENKAAAAQLFPGNQLIGQYTYGAFFARLNYLLKERYILSLTGRRDGTSRFGPANRFHNFGSIGGAWIFTDEPWVQRKSILSFGKLRASFGTTGSDQIGDYNYLSLYNYLPSSGLPYQSTTGIYPRNIPNPYLQWEQTNKLQAGIDISFFSNRINFSGTYSLNKSSNQLLSYPLPSAAGYTFLYRNIPATVQNRTWEIALNSKIIDRKFIKWTVSFNATLPKNSLISFPGIEISTYASTLVVNQPLDIIRTFKFIGVNSESGNYEYLDSKKTITESPVFPEDATTLITPSPKFFAGLENNLSIQRFELNFLFYCIKQTGANSLLSNQFQPGMFVIGYGNQPASVLNQWTASGDHAPISKYSSKNYQSIGENGYSDASFIQLKNLSLTYNLPELWQEKTRVRDAKIYFQGQNLFNITKWSELNPETKSSYVLPPLRIWTVGLKMAI